MSCLTEHTACATDNHVRGVQSCRDLNKSLGDFDSDLRFSPEITESIELIRSLFIVKFLLFVGLFTSTITLIRRKPSRLSGHDLKIVALEVLLFARARMFTRTCRFRHG